MLLASLLLLAGSLWQRDRLPSFQAALPALLQEPRQEPADRAPFETAAGGITYRVQPLQRYELHGVVVSRHDAQVWWDVVHRDWGDRLNVVDLCVVWGANLRDDNFRALRYWSEVFTCNVATDSDAIWSRFDPNALSNNHLLTADRRIARRLQGVRVGDQIRIRGYLSEYSHDQAGRPFRRGTSLVRTDRGDGACETIYVTEAQVLRAANPAWRSAFWIAWGGIAAAIGLWLMLPVRARE